MYTKSILARISRTVNFSPSPTRLFYRINKRKYAKRFFSLAALLTACVQIKYISSPSTQNRKILTVTFFHFECVSRPFDISYWAKFRVQTYKCQKQRACQTYGDFQRHGIQGVTSRWIPVLKCSAKGTSAIFIELHSLLSKLGAQVWPWKDFSNSHTLCSTDLSTMYAQS